VTPIGYNTGSGGAKVTGASSNQVTYACTATGSQTVAGSVEDISIGPSWALYGQCVDQTGENNPAASCNGAELDVAVNTTNTTDTNGERIILYLTTGGTWGGNNHFSHGLIFNNNNSNDTLDTGISFSAGYFGVGIDFSTKANTFSGLSGQSNATAILMSSLDNDTIGWKDTNGRYSANYGFYIHAAGDDNWYFDNPTGTNITFRGSGYANLFQLTSSLAVFSLPIQLSITTIAALPTCNSSIEGSFYAVSNGVSSPTYNGTVSTTGSTYQHVFCNRINWTYH
jgi:hypothetical protein